MEARKAERSTEELFNLKDVKESTTGLVFCSKCNAEQCYEIARKFHELQIHQHVIQQESMRANQVQDSSGEIIERAQGTDKVPVPVQDENCILYFKVLRAAQGIGESSGTNSDKETDSQPDYIYYNSYFDDYTNGDYVDDSNDN